MGLKERFESVLQETGMSAREWARKAGLKSETSVGHILNEHTKTMNPESLAALAIAAGVSVEWLTFGTLDKTGRPVPLPVYRRPAAELAHVSDSARDTLAIGIAIGACEDAGLSAALGKFYSEHQDPDATVVVKHFLHGLDRSAERAKTEREWSDEVLAYYRRIRKGASPFSGG